MEFRQVGLEGFTELCAESRKSSENRCSLEVLFSSIGNVSATQKTKYGYVQSDGHYTIVIQPLAIFS